MEVDQRKVKEDKEKSNFTDPQLLADNAVAQTKFINPDSKELLIKGTRRAVKTMLAKRNAWYGKKM
ncbi:hypothetical protein QTP88_007529 [Uroleucon formosanum]